jgi:hypothetical protein
MILSLFVLVFFAVNAETTTETTNYGLGKPGRGQTGWHVTINGNMDTLDAALGDISSEISDSPEVYFETGTFNYTTGDTITLPKSVSAITEYGVAVVPTSRAGSIGDIYVTQTTTNFVVKCSDNNTTDTFLAIIYYEGDLNAYGSSVYREWIVSPDSAITDHGAVGTTGSLAWVLSQAGADEVNVRLPGNHTYALQQDVTVAANITLKPDRGAFIDLNYSIRSASYWWTASGSGTNEYYLEATGGGDPGIEEPENVIEDNAGMVVGTMGSLVAGEWDWGDNDTLGFSTVYVRLSDSTDPDGKSAGYVEVEYAVTCNGGFAPVDPLGQYFIADAGSVTFGSSAVPDTRPEWWGSNTTPGTTDMSTAIQAAIDSIGSVGGRIAFTAPDYLTTSELTCPYSRITFVLYGSEITGSNTSGYVLSLGGNTGYTDIQVLGGRIEILGSTTGGIKADYVPNVVIRDVRIKSDATAGIGIYVLGGCFLGHIENNRITGGKFTKGILVESDVGNPNGLVIDNNWIVNDYATNSIGIHITASATKMKIRDTWVQHPDLYGIRLETGNKVEVSGCFLEGGTSSGAAMRIDTNANVVSEIDMSGWSNGIRVYGDENRIGNTYWVGNPTSTYNIEVQAGATNTVIITNSASNFSDSGTNTTIVDLSTTEGIKFVYGHLVARGTAAVADSKNVPHFSGFVKQHERPNSTPTSIDEDDCGKTFTNSGLATVELDLFDVGQYSRGCQLHFLNTAGGAITIDPHANDEIRPFGNGTALILDKQGQLLSIETATDATWSIVSTNKNILLNHAATADINADEAMEYIIHTNSGAGAIVLTLPSAEQGDVFRAAVMTAANLDINPQNADQIIGLTDAVGDAVRNATVGGTLILEALDSTNWYVRESYGTWSDVN